MSGHKVLSQRELEDLIDSNWSDIELPESSQSETEIDITVPQRHIKRTNLTDFVISQTEQNLDEDDELETEELIDLNENVNVEYIDDYENYRITQKKDIAFRRREFETEFPSSSENTFQTNDSENITVKTPFEYFTEYFPNDMFERMATYTNIYAKQTNNYKGSFRDTNPTEMMKFIGIHVLMGCLKLPQINMYWCNDLRIESVASVMSIDRFYQLRQTFHVVNNLEIPGNCRDKFVKIRPIINCVLKRCREVPVEEIIAVDEQIIPFTGHLSVKQYIKGKPFPWGIKVYALCGKSGFPYNFFLYQGKDSGLSAFEVARFGFGAATVLHLVKGITGPGHQLFFDNFFSSYGLFEILRDRGLKAAGTIRINRFNNPQFLSDAELKKKGRGSSDQLVSRDGKVVLVKWQDNRPVYLASNFVGKDQEKIVRRFDKKTKQYVTIPQPEVINFYNNGMGGVDLLDQLISYYRIFIKSKKWTLRIAFHFIDLAICASWIEYRKDCERTKVPEKDILKLLKFRSRIGRALTQSGLPTNRKRGRPSLSSQDQEPPLSTFHRPEIRPIREVQYDGVGHLPNHDDIKEAVRCKNLNCKGRSRIICTKCKVHLCLQKDRNCFADFHTK